MKKYIVSLLILFTGFACIAAAPTDNERQAISAAIEKVSDTVQSAPFGKKPIAILPLLYTPEWNQAHYGDMLIGPLKNVLTRAGFVCVEGKEDPMWEEILKEIAWDEKKNDILDPETLVAFGKLKAAKILMYGKLINLSENSERVYAEIELHATDLETKQHLWGGTFASRFYISSDVTGIVDLDASLRMLLKKNFEDVRTSLNSTEIKKKLDGLESISVIPLAGDIDEYITGLTIEAMTQVGLTPRNPQIPTLSLTRSFIRDKQLQAEGILYGAIRDLKKVRRPESDTLTQDAYEISSDIQLTIENEKGNILWSRTVTLNENEMVDKAMGTTEKVVIQNMGAIKWALAFFAIFVLVFVVAKLVSSFYRVR